MLGLFPQNFNRCFDLYQLLFLLIEISIQTIKIPMFLIFYDFLLFFDVFNVIDQLLILFLSLLIPLDQLLGFLDFFINFLNSFFAHQLLSLCFLLIIALFYLEDH